MMKTQNGLSGRLRGLAAGVAVVVAAGLAGVPAAEADDGTSVLQLAQQFKKIPQTPTPKSKPLKLAVPLVEISVPVILENVHPDVNKAIVKWGKRSHSALLSAV